MPTFDLSDKIIVIFYVSNSKNILRLRVFKLLLSLSASASASAPSAPISLLSKIMRKWKNNRLVIAIKNKKINFI